MIDILLVLLVFFMAIATDQVAQAKDGVMLPTAKLEQGPISEMDEAVLSLYWSPTATREWTSTVRGRWIVARSLPT